MRESIGGSLLLNIVIIFAGLVIIFFAGILSYSKAYRVKNRTIELLEKYEEFVMKDSTYDPGTQQNGQYDVMDALLLDLRNAGYDASDPTQNCERVRNRLINNNTGKYNPELLSNNKNNYGYNLCIFEMCNEGRNGNGSCEGSFYYVVVSFVRFEFPIIGDVLTFPVYGETKMLGKNYDY